MFTLTQSGFAEQTINKSKFLAWAGHCENERELGAFFRSIAAQHASAHHMAYAFRINTLEGIVSRFSDAGEPSGTAGKPILQMLEGRDLVNTCVGVIRYYGGINLGTGGLVRAYGGTAKMALEAAQIVPFVPLQTLKFKVDYPKLEILLHALGQCGAQVVDKIFDAQVTVIARVPKPNVAGLTGRFEVAK